jgi:adenosylmethionine-8-amino-7-oxononanoate aminotransferase
MRGIYLRCHLRHPVASSSPGRMPRPLTPPARDHIHQPFSTVPSHHKARMNHHGSSAVLHRKLGLDMPVISKAQGQYIFLDDGRCILDASGGAAVACLGHGDKRVLEAMKDQAEQTTYCATAFFTTRACEALCQTLVDTAPNHFARAYIVSSGQPPLSVEKEE